MPGLDKIVHDIEHGLRTLHRCLSDLQGALTPPPPGPGGTLTYLREPWVRALAKLPGVYMLVLANFEILLSHICDSTDPDKMNEFFRETFVHGPPGYWSNGAIAQGVADAAVMLGVLDAYDRDQLLKPRVWDRPSFSIQECVKDLEESIVYLSSLLDRLKPRLRVN